MEHAPRQRLFTGKRADPQLVNGRYLLLPDVKRYFQHVHEHGGWKGKAMDAQSKEEFAMEGSLVSNYGTEILDRKIKKVYVPLAYVGKVAKAISDAGIDVLAGDLSDRWVEHNRKLGIRAEKRSFEQLPEEHFDAVVCFEPYPVSSRLTGFLGMMEIMKRMIPFLGIREMDRRGFESVSSFLKLKQSVKFGAARIKLSWSEDYYPSSITSMHRLAYDYGARIEDRMVFDGKNPFTVECSVPTQDARRQVALDLQVFSRNEEWFGNGCISLAELSKQIGIDIAEAAASVERMISIFNERLEVENMMNFYGPKAGGRLTGVYEKLTGINAELEIRGIRIVG